MNDDPGHRSKPDSATTPDDESWPQLSRHECRPTCDHAPGDDPHDHWDVGR